MACKEYTFFSILPVVSRQFHKQSFGMGEVRSDVPLNTIQYWELFGCFSHLNLHFPHFQVTEYVVRTVDNTIEYYKGNTSIPKALNQIQRALDQQISTLQTNPGNTTIDFIERNMAIEAVKVKKEDIVSRYLVFEAIIENDTLDTTVMIGEPPKKEAEAAISFQLPSDVLSDVDGM